MFQPRIRDAKRFGIENCPTVPTFEAGYLVSGNGGWRNRTPVVDLESCVGCLQCYLYCPDGAVSVFVPTVEGAGKKVSIDYEFCKGCGICAKMCKPGAVRMEG